MKRLTLHDGCWQLVAGDWWLVAGGLNPKKRFQKELIVVMTNS